MIVAEPEIAICSVAELPVLKLTGSELPEGVAVGAESGGAALTLGSLDGGLAG
ncbi:MAG: hypothetical protein WBV60_05465 [Terriglobales bacterium]